VTSQQFIRTKAFYIWLDEGCPEGRADAKNAVKPVEGAPAGDDSEARLLGAYMGAVIADLVLAIVIRRRRA
jgi:Protein of unknown function (DUF2934)